MRGLVSRVRSLWRGGRAGDALQREMDEEFRLHQEMRAADLVKAGHSPEEAQRRARLEFGSAERYKHEGRRSRGLRAFDGLRISWLDVKLGLRMLARYPGITIVGGFAMAFAIWVGAGTFEFVRQVLHPSLPLPQGDRIVAIEVRNALTNRGFAQVAHDLVEWQSELTTVRELGAYRMFERNLVDTDGYSAPTEVAEISASAFPLTRVTPLLGRPLVAGDEQADAPAVAVIGHRLWQQRFAGDSSVVGRTVQLGRTATTIVGVMPEGFAFPVAQSLWTPLRLNVLDHERGSGPSLRVFGRLAPGTSLDEAQAELATVGRRTALDHPRTHQHLRPQVMPYAQSVLGISTLESLFIGSTNLVLVLFLLLVCGNVALLMFARAATRESEIVVRTALGAGRSRIVGQLFAEALVLGAVAALVGLAAASAGMRWGFRTVLAEVGGNRIPFWFQPSLSPTTVLYVALLTVLGAVVAGVLPALKVTRGLQHRLRAAGAGGGGLRFGGVWTTIIVAQIAVTVILPVIAWATQRDKTQLETMPVHIREGEFLSAMLMMDREPPPTAPGDTTAADFARRFEAATTELARRVASEPGVAGVTFAERLPRTYHPHRLIELDSGGAAPRHPDWPDGHRVSSAAVATDYFPVIGAPILSGRDFHSGDLATEARTVVVNEHFVETVLGGRNPIGRHLRYVHFEERDEPVEGAPPEPWYQIVGVVPTMGMAGLQDPKAAGIYHPLVPGTVHPVRMAVHARGDPAALEPRLRELAAAVDPTLRVDRVVPIDALSDSELRFIQFWVQFTLVLTLVAVMLSLAGIYAVMSFTVSRRTREIGIRVALGARASRVVLTILKRPLAQVAGGVAAGTIVLLVLFGSATEQRMTAQQFAMLGVYAVAMLGVCLLACIVPTRRALRVEPTEALRADG